MTTRTAMKTDIASILGRNDLSSQAETAISHAISTYQGERLFFKESRELSFNCVVGQVYYGASDDADIGLISQFDAIHARISNNDISLRRIPSIDEFEALQDGNVSNGQPIGFIYYAQKIGLYPPPDDTYTITIMGGTEPAAPASDGEASNVWMTEAYNLVLYRAVAWLNRFIIRDYDLANQMELEAERELMRLRRKTSHLKATNRLQPTCW